MPKTKTAPAVQTVRPHPLIDAAFRVLPNAVGRVVNGRLAFSLFPFGGESRGVAVLPAQGISDGYFVLHPGKRDGDDPWIEPTREPAGPAGLWPMIDAALKGEQPIPGSTSDMDVSQAFRHMLNTGSAPPPEIAAEIEAWGMDRMAGPWLKTPEMYVGPAGGHPAAPLPASLSLFFTAYKIAPEMVRRASYAQAAGKQALAVSIVSDSPSDYYEAHWVSMLDDAKLAGWEALKGEPLALPPGIVPAEDRYAVRLVKEKRGRGRPKKGDAPAPAPAPAPASAAVVAEPAPRKRSGPPLAADTAQIELLKKALDAGHAANAGSPGILIEIAEDDNADRWRPRFGPEYGIQKAWLVESFTSRPIQVIRVTRKAQASDVAAG